MTICLPARRASQPRWLRDPLWTRARMVPSFDIDANWGPTPIDRVSGLDLTTHTRAASATYVDSDGSIRTAGTNVLRRQWDATNRRWGWLVEEARSNLLLNSETLSTQSVTVAATAYTLSFYGTGSITRSGTSTGTTNGISAAEPVSVTFTPTAGSLTLTVSGSVKFANLEAGSFGTSWIPTTDTAATRDADVWTVTGDKFSRWYRQDEGSVYVEAITTNTVGNGIVGFDDGTNNERWRLGHSGATSGTMVGVDGGSVVFNSQSSADTWPLGTSGKSAGRVQLNNSTFAVNGIGQLVDTSCTIPTVTTMTIGAAQASAYANGTISRLVYWGQRLPSSTLQSLTS